MKKLIPHKHSENIKKWADGYIIESFNSGIWEIDDSPIWLEDIEYRVFDPLREVKEAFERGETIQAKMKNFHRWEDYIKGSVLSTVDAITEEYGWEWRVKPKHNPLEEIAENDWLIITGFLFNLSDVREGMVFRKNRFLYEIYNYCFRKATKQEVLNAPNYDGTATFKDFEPEVGDYYYLEEENRILSHIQETESKFLGKYDNSNIYASKEDIILSLEYEINLRKQKLKVLKETEYSNGKKY